MFWIGLLIGTFATILMLFIIASIGIGDDE